MRSLKTIIKALPINMGGLIVDQALPSNDFKQIDPFLLIHHARQKFKSDKDIRRMGVAPHPHRGFSPVTIIEEGAVQHRDSLGNDSIVAQGGLQWMHAGSGVIHSERPPKKLVEQNGTMEILQIWVNTPEKHKFEGPWYMALHTEDIQIIKSPDGLCETYVLAGQYQNATSPVKTYSPLSLLKVRMMPEGKVQFSFPEDQNLMVYAIKGQIKINGEHDVSSKHLAVFDNNGKTINITGNKESKFLIMAGQPIDEEVATYGPFVLNKASQILESIRDFESGNMGRLEEKFE